MGNQTGQRRLLLLLSGLCVLVLIGQTLVSTARWLNEPFPGFFVYENLTVGPYYAPGWSGAAAGLRSLDRVVSVDGEELRNRAQLYNLVHNAPVGSVLQYRVVRDEQVLDIKIPSLQFTLRDWLLCFGMYIVIGLAFLVIGVAPYFYRASSAVALPLCFMVLLVFVWFQTTFDFMTDGILPKEIRIFALALTPSAAIHLALLLKNANLGSSPRRSQLAAIYATGVFLGALNIVTFFLPAWIWIPVYRSSYIFVCVGAVAFLLIIAKALRESQSDLDRSRLRVMLVGSLVGFLIPALSTTASSFDLRIPYNMALIPTIFFPISIAYALLKYSLFDLSNALKVALSRIGLVASLIGIYAVLALLVAPWAGQYAKDPLVPIFFSVLVVAVFNPLLRWMERVVDRYIYRQDYDPAITQAEISLFLRTLDDAPALAQGFVDRIIERPGILSACVVYRSKHSSQFITAASAAMTHMDETIVGEFNLVVEVLASRSYRGVSRDEVTKNPHYSDNREALLGVFERCEAELFLPLVFEREVRGMVCLGAKRSHNEYSAEDLRLVVTLSEQLALSLENGRLYEESVIARKKAEASNRRLLEMDRIKKDFVANICHELRTPVSTIIGFSEILREDLSFNANAHEHLNRLITNSQELSSLMDNLMNFARMEADGPSTQFEIVKLREILAALEMMTQRLIRERPIKFGIHLESSVDTIESDGQKLQQILVHLLTNALKFTEKGRIELTIRQRRESEQDILEIAVADTGIGIKREDQDVIFDDFRQLEGSSTRRYGGTGLGLGLCKKLAAALGGEMRVSSEYGVGSVFSVLLPVRVLEPAVAQ
jgi:signal transduction histidine kinase